MSRLLVLWMLAGCSIGMEPIATTPPRQPWPSLDHQDPSADTSKNRIISRSESEHPHTDDTAAAATLAAYALDIAFRRR